MNKIILPLAFAATTLIATSCSDDAINDTTPQIPDSEKTKIEFLASDGSTTTRAGFTGKDGNNENQDTYIVARFSSKNKNTNDIRHTRTVLIAKFDSQASDGKNWNSCSSVDFLSDDNKRYWDDCFGRDGQLSIYAIAVPNKASLITNNNVTLEAKLTQGSTAVGNTKWYSDTEDNKVSWKVTDVVNPESGQSEYKSQTSTTMGQEDLCYSNNIKESGKDGILKYSNTDSKYPEYLYAEHNSECSHDSYKHDFYPNMTDGPMLFQLVDDSAPNGPGHFDHGHMIFKHALCRITVDIKGGTGFDYSNETNFTLQSQKTYFPATIDLLKMNISGDFDICTGAWSNLTQSENTYMFCGEKKTGEAFGKDKVIYSLSAQVLPGYVVNKDNITDNFMTFNIDNNNYYVTQKEIFVALNTDANNTKNEVDGSQKVTLSNDGNSITLEPGKNYHFTITVNKTGINAVTCTLVDWVDVEGAFAAKNSYIEFTSLETSETGDNDCEHFDLYRVLNTSSQITSPTQKDFVDDDEHKIQFMQGYVTSGTYTADMVSTESSESDKKITINSTITGTGTKKVFTTPWFFQDNYSFYHFRSVVPGTIIKADNSGDYFTMYSGPMSDSYTSGNANFPTQVLDGDATAAYNDYHWGAIFKPSDSGTPPAYPANLKYDTDNGFENSLKGPVGPTTSTLNLIEQHMMSNIKVVLLTPSDGDAVKSAVDLYVEKTGDPQHPGNVSTINLTNFQGTAKVRMGNGLITPEGDPVSKTLTKPTFTVENTDNTTTDNNYCASNSYQFNSTGQKYYKTKAYTYRVVPQPLVVGSGSEEKKVGLTIQTPDNNMYYVVDDLANIEVSNVSGNALKNDYEGWDGTTKKKIDRWLPGYTYTYYFILKKTGIEALTCTIVDWVTVEGAPTDITLED